MLELLEHHLGVALALGLAGVGAPVMPRPDRAVEKVAGRERPHPGVAHIQRRGPGREDCQWCQAQNQPCTQ